MNNFTFSSLKKTEVHPLIKKVWLFTAIIFSLLFLMLFLPWQQTVEGEGKVIAYDPTQRDYSILATIDGLIDTYHVKENQYVTKGTKLFTMVDLDKEYLYKLKTIKNSSEDKYKNAQIQISNFAQKKNNLREYLQMGINVYKQKIEQTKNKVKSLQFRKISVQKNFEVEKLNFERVRKLYKEGIESKRNFDIKENVYINAKAKLEKTDIDIEIENNNLSIINKEKDQFIKETENKIRLLDNSSLSSKNILRSLDQDVQRDSANLSRYAMRTVVAEKDGYVVRIFQNDKNKLIKKGDKILYFAPKVSRKLIRLKVSDFNMPLIKEGLPVRVMFYGWPALQITGWPKISFGTFGGIIHNVDPTSHEKGYYYAHIVEDPNEPWPEGNDLRVGTQSNVWVRLSTVPIWYQLWRLMNALPPQMVSPNVEKKK